MKFVKISEDEYQVTMKTNVIGIVCKTWRNFGGTGWTYIGEPLKLFRTRKLAAEALIKSKEDY